MGRTRIAKAVIKDLSEKKESSQKRKDELIGYLKKLNQAHLNEKISGAKYVEILHNKNNGRNIKEWVDYYENYSKNCEREIENQKKRIIKTKLPTFFLSILFASILIYVCFFSGLIHINFTGFSIGGNEQKFSQNLYLNLSENTSYEWQLENIGQLQSAKLNGLIKGNGEVKIYLDDLLILDSSKIKSERSILTGGVIDESGNDITTSTGESTNANTPTSNSETEAPSKEESSPSQGELLTENNSSSTEITQKQKTTNESTNETINQINKTTTETNTSNSEVLNQSEALPNEESSPSQGEPLTSEENTTTNIIANSNETITETQNQTIVLTKTFKGICEETCNLNGLNLSKSSYTLRIEITDAKLQLDTIDYSIIPEEIISEGNITLENSTINTTQYQAILGQPVKWKKEISLDEAGSVNVELPKEAENIIVRKISGDKSNSEVLNQSEALPKEESSPSQGEPLTSENEKIKQTANADIETKIKSNDETLTQQAPLRITGNAISTKDETPLINESEVIQVSINDNATNYEVTYETPAPYAVEQNLTNGKRVEIVGPETIHYENVLVFTKLSESLNIKNPSEIQIHWIENDSYISPTKVEDKDNNGIYDYVEWVAPHLSNQTFDIIVITKAEHLNSNRIFISDIYDKVKSLDNIWSETIPANDYVRVTFEMPLDNTRDITLYPRIVSGTPRIEVYGKDSTTKIAEFTNLNSNQYNKVLLTNLKETQDTFDLKVVDGNVEFDYIIDPTFNKRTYSFMTYTNNSMYWGLPSATYVAGGGTNASATNYTNVAKIDGNYGKVCSTATSGNYELYERFNFTINEPLASINWINITWKGNYSSNGETAVLWAYNYSNTGTWINLGTIASGAMGNMTINYTTAYNIGNVVGSNKQLVIYPRGDNFDTGDCLYTDYVEVLVGFTDDNPDWSSHSENGSLKGNYIKHSLNLTDVFGLSGYIFSFDNGTGTFTNDSFVVATGTQSWANVSKWIDTANGETIRWIVYFNDTANQWNSSDIFSYTTTTPPDVTKPYFSTIPANDTSWYGNESLNVTFVGADETGFGYYSDNDSRFTIGSSSGFLTNSTPMAVGDYSINISINDSSNNLNWTRYTVHIDKSNYYDCGVYFNIGSPATYPTNFSAFTNCSSAYKIYRNTSQIVNYTNVSGGAGYYNLTVQRTDIANYTNTVMSQFFTINKNAEFCSVLFNETSPLESPKTFNVWANCTTAFVLARNGTTIANNTEQALTTSAYNFSMSRNDTSNYSYIYNDSQFIINAALDSTPPTITFESPTPTNTSTVTSSNQTIVANISDASLTSTWIDFNKDLVGYWPMDYYNHTVIFDNSTYKNNATFAAGTGLNYSNITAGARGNGLKFDGVNDYMDVDEGSSLNLSRSTGYTMSAWIKPTSWGDGYERIFDYTPTSGTTDGFTMFIASSFGKTNSLFVMHYHGADNTYNASSNDNIISLNVWQHVLATYNGTGILFYVNGTFVNYVTLAGMLPITSIDIFSIGRRADNARFFNGTMDELMIFNRSLSSTEVSALYDSQSNKFNASFTNLATGQHNYTVYAIDASGNTNSSYQNFNVSIATDSTSPKWYSNSTNGTAAGNYILHSVNWTDETALSGYIFEFDNGNGTAYNDSFVTFTGTANWSNVSKTINSTIGATIKWRVYSNDSSNNKNSTSIFQYTIPDTTKPTITFESPTPANTSTVTSSNQTIVANISDASDTSSWIDFDKGLVGYWAMDYYNATGIYDNSSYNNFGTFSPALNYSNLTTGMRGKALKFGGGGALPNLDTLTITSTTALDSIGCNNTFSMWVKPDSLGDYNFILSKYNNSGAGGFGFDIGTLADGAAAITYRDGTADDGYFANIFSVGNWVHLTLTQNGSGYVYVYKNGIYQGFVYSQWIPGVPNQRCMINPIGSALQIGWRLDSSYFNGSIDEVMIFNRSLSSTEVSALYNSQSNKFNASFTNLALGQHNYTVYAIDASGNANSSYQNFIYSQSAPVIWNVTPISAVTLTDGPSPTFVVVNFSVYDANGASSLNNATAAINFTKSGEDYRSNSSCAVKDFSGNYANYTCNVTMQYWDAAGSDWKVYANITDLNSNLAVNDTTTFTVNPLTGFVISPSALTFSSITAGFTNQTPTSNFILNNTGNVDISVGSIQINATDLVGENDASKFLFAGNFSASPYTGGNIECNVTASATAMVNMSYTSIANTVLAAGNYSKNDGVTGQEKVYMCLRQIGSELSTQAYSTKKLGSWTIKIALVLVSVRRKKKKNSKNSISTTIPITIFSNKLGALEALTKYMKENLEMSYHRIAELLNRDERTIWTAYSKSLIKQKETIQVKENTIFLPISVLNNRKLTILESLVLYLKEENMKYSEIAKLLHRDERNIWTIYSRVANNLNKNEIENIVNIKVELNIPITIFSNKLGALELISKYMKENLGMSYHEIARLLNRNDRTIWTAYSKSLIKQKETIIAKETDIFLPISLFINRKLTPLESIIVHLKSKNMKYTEIANLLNRDERNIWTIYNKAKNNL